MSDRYLYHSGRKGMKWYQTIFTSGNKGKSSFNSEYSVPSRSSSGAKVKRPSAKETAKSLSDDDLTRIVKRRENEFKYVQFKGPTKLKTAKTSMEEGQKIVTGGKTVYNAAIGIKKTKNQVDISKMSDAELTREVNRMNLEQRYSALKDSQVSKGSAYINRILEIGGGTLLAAGAALGIAVSIKELRDHA